MQNENPCLLPKQTKKQNKKQSFLSFFTFSSSINFSYSTPSPKSDLLLPTLPISYRLQNRTVYTQENAVKSPLALLFFFLHLHTYGLSVNSCVLLGELQLFPWCLPLIFLSPALNYQEFSNSSLIISVIIQKSSMISYCSNDKVQTPNFDSLSFTKPFLQLHWRHSPHTACQGKPLAFVRLLPASNAGSSLSNGKFPPIIQDLVQMSLSLCNLTIHLQIY